MIEYRVHLAALDAFREQLALTDFDDPSVAGLRDEEVADAGKQPAATMLGAVIDHLMLHASSDGYELELLARAATLWREGLGVYDALAEFRVGLETALRDPSDAAAVGRLNAASLQIQPLTQRVLAQNDAIQALRRDVAEMRHLPPHPRQENLPLTEWRWGDLFLARRTEAFAREVRKQVSDPVTNAFALGVLSSYGANAAGSAYLTQVVGGSRRGHRFRDRLARNVVGSWAADHDPSVPSLTSLLQQLDQAFPAGLPASIDSMVQAAVANVYDPGVVPAFLDLQLGYQRLREHLRLLDAFRLPDAPALPREPFLSSLFANPSSSYVPSMPEGTGLVEAGEPAGSGGSSAGTVMPQSYGTDDSPTSAEPPRSTEVKCGAFWEAIGSAFLFLIGGWLYCVISWSGPGRPRCDLWDNITQNWEEAFTDGAVLEVGIGSNAALTASDVAAIAQSDQITQLIGDLHNLQTLMWEGFQKAHEFLAVFGLVYPDGLLDRWRYRQYLTIPHSEPGDWPKLPETGPRFDEYPTTNVEQPASISVAYGPGVTPAAVLARVPEPGTISAADVSLAVWEQIARGVLDSSNLDLDADRHWRHACWQPHGNIADQPIDVRVLGYEEI